YTTIFIFTCIYYIGTIIGYFDGLDIVGEEDVIIVLIPITLILIMILILVGIFGNKYICKRMDVEKLNYFLFSGLIFLLVFGCFCPSPRKGGIRAKYTLFFFK
ncbi:hypothetical protein, partial [Bacillus pseudomycoides]|uniref:hypothetical protein n=1 Tax=Bacillus pseudomycoides TaxID=64104 RepID=UPI0023D97BD4